MLSSLTPPQKKGFGRAGRKSCWWLEKNVFYPPHLTLDMTNATRDIESNGVTKGFTSWFKTKGCLGFVWKQVGKRCNKSNDKTQCFARGVSIPELQNFVALLGFKFCHVFSKIVLSLRDSTHLISNKLGKVYLYEREKVESPFVRRVVKSCHCLFRNS